MTHAWHENEDTRRYSVESEDHALSLGLRKLSKKSNRIRSESHFGSLNSNLNQLGAQGPLEVNKMFLTDDYFSDVNPRSMRRLMNVIYVMGRLLKAFSIDFNWHHLASWANITEQWPYHTSWIILFVENYGDKFEDSMSLKQIYDIVHPHIPTQKEIEPLIELDRDKKKLDVFLTLHKKTLTVADIKVYMPFTINLDPFLRKVIKEEVQNMEEFGLTLAPGSKKSSVIHENQAPVLNKAMLTRRQAAELSKKMGDIGVPGSSLLAPSLVPPYMGLQLPSPQPMAGLQLSAGGETQARKIALPRPVLPRELQGLVLSSLNLEQVSLLIRTIEGINSSMVDTYCSSVVSSNITGQVLLHCEVAELKSVLNMNFGDWELFKLVLTGMRDDECNSLSRQSAKLSSFEASKEGEAISQPRKKSNYEKQVAMEQAAVSGLLSTLNEDAKEDILNVELDDAIEAAAKVTNLDRQLSQEEEESDYIYYSHPVPGSKVFTKDEVTASADMERGQRARQSRQSGSGVGEMRWSAASSLAGSCLELDAIVHQAATSPGSSGRESSSQNNKKIKPVSRTATTLSFLQPKSSVGGEEDPYSWLSATAPPSPREERGQSRQFYFSDSNTQERESDPGHSRMSIFSNRSVKRTKKRQNSKDDNQHEESDDNMGLSRSSSRVKLDKLRRKVKNALTSNEPGQLPMVQKARPNADEYQEFNKSQKNSPYSSMSGSVCLSDESDSQEQQTIARRPDGAEAGRPTVQNIFPEATSKAEGLGALTATLPDGSKMTSSKKIFTIGDTEKQNK